MDSIGTQESSISHVIDDDVIDVASLSKDALSKNASPPGISCDSSDEFQFGHFSDIQ